MDASSQLEGAHRQEEESQRHYEEEEVYEIASFELHKEVYCAAKDAQRAEEDKEVECCEEHEEALVSFFDRYASCYCVSH